MWRICFFWHFKRRRLIVFFYRLFGGNLSVTSSVQEDQGPSIFLIFLDCLAHEDGTDRLSETTLKTTDLRCVTPQKSKYLIYTAAQAWTHASKCVPTYALGYEGIWGSGGIAPYILSFRNRCRSKVSFTSYSHYPRTLCKGVRVDQIAGSGCIEELSLSILSPVKPRIFCYLSNRLVTIRTELSYLPLALAHYEFTL